ncbi:MAG: hypothetical protein ABSE49_21380 [Polyangiaceae bacterium]|jgi:hypothetical protein
MPRAERLPPDRRDGGERHDRAHGERDVAVPDEVQLPLEKPPSVLRAAVRRSRLQAPSASSRTPQSTLAEALLSVWGSGPSDVWAVDWAAGIQRWNGSAWSQYGLVDAGMYPPLSSVWGSGPGDVWAVGEVPTFIHIP